MERILSGKLDKYPFNQEQFTRVRTLIYREAGIALAPGKRDMVYSCLARRVRARQYGYRVAEVPIIWKNSTASKVRPVPDSLQMLVDLVKIRLANIGQKQAAVKAPLESA